MGSYVKIIKVVKYSLKYGGMKSCRIPYYPTKWDIVKKILEIYTPRPNERILELGCGDARVIRSIAMKYDDILATGVEINPILVNEASKRVYRDGISDRVDIIRGDLFKFPINEYDTIYAYLTKEALFRLKDKFNSFLRNGGKIIALDFKIPGIKPSQSEIVDVSGKRHILYLYHPRFKKI